MALQRIRFSSNSNGSSPYTLTLNPSRLNVPTNSEYVALRSLDGGQTLQHSYFDAREITLSWVRIPLDYSGYQAMASTLKGYIGLTKYVNYGDVEYRIGTVATWQKVIVADAQMDAEPGGKLKTNLTVTLIPEP